MMETPLEAGLLLEQGASQGGTRGAPHRRLKSNAWSSITSCLPELKARRAMLFCYRMADVSL